MGSLTLLIPEALDILTRLTKPWDFVAPYIKEGIRFKDSDLEYQIIFDYVNSMLAVIALM